MGMTEKEREDWMAEINRDMKFIDKLVGHMRSKNLRRARAKCWRDGCKGMVHVALVGRNNHFRAACTEPRCVQAME